nr:16S rRNA (guanine(527)-N(7))-methyltransferase RsmG [Marinimicrobium alkaliphilum]
MALSLTDRQIDQLMDYLALFHQWNKAYNLSAVRDPAAMIGRHLLDSLSVVPHLAALDARRIIDVGTGGGLPGIPLAIVFPEREFTLLDSAGKKTRFLFHVKSTLGLANVQVENRRAEAWAPSETFDLVTSRAFASLADMVSVCEHLLSPGGRFMAMKGVYPAEELRALGDRARLENAVELAVPETEGERHLLILGLPQ